MKIILDFLAKLKTQAEPAVAITAAIADTEAEQARLGPVLVELSDRRRELLLGDDDAALDAVEREQTAVTRQLDRLDVVLEELRARHTEADRREREAALVALRRRAEAHRDAGAAAVGSYLELARKIAAALVEHDQHLDALRAVNSQLAAAGVPQVETPAMAARRGAYANDGFANQVRLPDPTRHPATIWPSSGGGDAPVSAPSAPIAMPKTHAVGEWGEPMRGPPAAA